MLDRTGKRRSSAIARHEDGSSEERGLHRSLHAPGLVIHYVASVIGVGVLILPGHAASAAGPLSLLAWLALVVYSYPFALIFARLSTRFPTSKGIPEFVERAFGRHWGRFTALFLILTLLVANPVLGLAAARYALTMSTGTPPMSSVILLGAGVVLGSIVFNLAGIRLGIRVQSILLSSLIAFLVLVMLVALPHADASNLSPFASHGWRALGSALIICFFGFIGWENAAPVAEEVVDPAKTFPRAILVAVLLVGGLYVAMALTVVLVVPESVGSAEKITAFSTLLEIASGRRLAQAGNLVAVVLLVLATNAWVLGTSRVVYSAARDGLLPPACSRVSGRRNVPRGALLFLIPGYGMFLVALAASGRDESVLITATSAAFLLVFMLTFLAAHRLLVGTAIRRCNYTLMAATAAIAPFLGSSVLFAAALALTAWLLSTAARRANRPMRGALRADSEPGDGVASGA